MALSPNLLLNYESGTGGNDPDFTSSSFTPANNVLLTVIVSYNPTGTAGGASGVITGGGLVWTRRALADNANNYDMMTQIWTAPVVLGASMAITYAATTNADASPYLTVIEWSGYDVVTPVGATGSAVGGSRSGAYNLSLSGTSESDSYILGSGIADSGAATHGTGWTSAAELEISGFMEVANQYKSGAMSTADWDALTTSFSFAAAAIEINAAAGGSTAVDGDLQAQAATIDGIVNVIVTAAADLQAQNAQIAGTVSVAIAVTGALEAQAAAISGAVSVIVTVDGDLQAQTASIAGAISALIAIDGDLNAQASQISGIASTHIAVDGDLEAQAAQIDGTILTGTPISGALAAQDAFIAGILTVNIALLAAIQAQNAQTAGAIAIALASGGSITSQNASIDGSISTELLRPPKNTFVKRAGWGRSARFWVERDR